MTNPLIKKGTPKFPSKDKEKHEQLEHPETKGIPYEKETEIVQEGEIQPLNEIIDQLRKKERKIEKKQVSIYLDVDVINAFNEYGKVEGKGAKSDLVNEFLKKAFNIRQGEK